MSSNYHFSYHNERNEKTSNIVCSSALIKLITQEDFMAFICCESSKSYIVMNEDHTTYANVLIQLCIEVKFSP
jgi:hypothetical protein